MLDATNCRALLASDPGNSIFPDFADFLRRRNEFDEALRVCLAGLSASPADQVGRLILARIYFDQGFIAFAAKEVAELGRQLPENPRIRKLLEAFSPEGPPPVVESEGRAESTQEEEIAEAEIDIDDLT